MEKVSNLRLALEDLLADLQYARRNDDPSRLALIACCEVRRWARRANENGIAEHASRMVIACPHATRAAFPEQVDALTACLDDVKTKLAS